MAQRVIPMLSYEDVGRSADWIADAFGFRETDRYTDPDGTVSHINMAFDDDLFMLGRPSPHYQSPRRHAEMCEHARKWSETPYIVDGVLVLVDDLNDHYSRAKAAGARMLSEPKDTGHGLTYCAEDVEGHRWMFSQAS